MEFRLLKPTCTLKFILGVLLSLDCILLAHSLDDSCYYENGPHTLVEAIQSCGTIPQIDVSQSVSSDPLANVYDQLKAIPIQQFWVVVVKNQKWTYTIMNLTTSFQVDRANAIADSRISGLRLDNIGTIASQTLPAICYSCGNFVQCPQPQIMHQNKCYWITTVEGDFNNMDATCSASYGILSPIESQETHRLLSIFEKSNQDDPAWIGLQDSDADNKWQWSDMSTANFPSAYSGFAQIASRKKRSDDNNNIFSYLLPGYTGTYPQGWTWPYTWPTASTSQSTTETTETTQRSTTASTKVTTPSTTETTETTKKSTTPTTSISSTRSTSSTTPITSVPTIPSSSSTPSTIETLGTSSPATALTNSSLKSTLLTTLTSVSNGTLSSTTIIGNGNFSSVLTSPTTTPPTPNSASSASPSRGSSLMNYPSGCVTNDDQSSGFAWLSRNCSSRFKGICVAYESSCDQTSRYYRGKCYSCPVDGLTCSSLQCSTGNAILVNSSTDPIVVLINAMQCSVIGVLSCTNVFPMTMCDSRESFQKRIQDINDPSSSI